MERPAEEKRGPSWAPRQAPLRALLTAAAHACTVLAYPQLLGASDAAFALCLECRHPCPLCGYSRIRCHPYSTAIPLAFLCSCSSNDFYTFPRVSKALENRNHILSLFWSSHHIAEDVHHGIGTGAWEGAWHNGEVAKSQSGVRLPGVGPPPITYLDDTEKAPQPLCLLI